MASSRTGEGERTGRREDGKGRCCQPEFFPSCRLPLLPSVSPPRRFSLSPISALFACTRARRRTPDAAEKCTDARRGTPDAAEKCTDAWRRTPDAAEKCTDAWRRTSDAAEKCTDARRRTSDAAEKCTDAFHGNP